MKKTKTVYTTSMASVSSIFPLILVIIFAVGQINAAALQPTKTLDLDDSNLNKNETSSTYKSIEEEHLTVNESKVVIDFYTPSQPNESNGDLKSTDKNVTPYVQLVINQPNESSSSTTEQQQSNTDSQISELPTVESSKENSLQLIPPADVNASINKLEKDSPQKQGQIIIRYE
ncbi:uncharacterized protein LOC116350037 [Contarinia nasturtii]|uniref:uncharacterized protein LOC116350037 n=1 Tax=Contarinia nasturtii TaxID=265458 RepID=UPI0012D38BE2|nr:uncharacterized protein LOC116350037 [Contarinia nasturtii]XP_031637613.1 uncharacterized protein LOC116350037 [Contarinia nasturtii]